MCWGCWEERGSPAIINERTLMVYAMLEQLEDIPAYGSGLHAVVDDWNSSDEHIKSSLEDLNFSDTGEFRNSIERRSAESEILRALLAMTLDERHTVLALDEGLITPEGRKTY